MCNDKAINYLSSIGFSAIQLPMMGIEPLHLMRIRENDYLESLGPVVNLIEPCTERLTPDIKKDCKVTDPHLDGLVTDSFGFNIGTGIVNDILKQFGLQNDILKQFGFSYQKVKKVKFSLVDRTEKSTPLLLNRDFLSSAGLIVDPSEDFVLTDRPEGYSPKYAKGDPIAGVEVVLSNGIKV